MGQLVSGLCAVLVDTASESVSIAEDHCWAACRAQLLERSSCLLFW